VSSTAAHHQLTAAAVVVSSTAAHQHQQQFHPQQCHPQQLTNSSSSSPPPPAQRHQQQLTSSIIISSQVQSSYQIRHAYKMDHTRTRAVQVRAAGKSSRLLSRLLPKLLSAASCHSYCQRPLSKSWLLEAAVQAGPEVSATAVLRAATGTGLHR